MTSFDRPVSVADTLNDMVFTYAEYEYNASGAKARCTLPVIGLERCHLGGVFERDARTWEEWDEMSIDPVQRSETVQRLFLGGSAYDAPMVLVKEDGGAWTPYNIGRDVQGSITHVLTTDGNLVERYVYDPWGKVAQADSVDFIVDSIAVNIWGGPGFWSKIVGSHGYTGHEYIIGCGLLNANARIYDPFIGRFLSPDPLIQDPTSTQNFNRYAYCLNNPLKYTDEDGEFWWPAIGIFIGGVSNVIANWNQIQEKGIWVGMGYFGVGATIGFLSSIGASWTAGITQAAGVWGGALIGAGTGALTGAATNSLTTIGNNLLSHNKWDSGLKSAAINGALIGAVSGAISGGIRGYHYAKERGANPFTNRVKGTETAYERDIKQGIPNQNRSDEYCYAHASAYADAGHGNHSVEDFIAYNNNAKGADVSALEKLSGAKLVAQGDMSTLTSNTMKIGNGLFNPRLEMLATIPGGDNMDHWVNIYKITASSRLNLFGGGSSFTPISLSYWDPATGSPNLTSSVLFFKVFLF